MTPLANYLRDELARRDWSIDEFAKKAGLSLSNAYLIIRDGKDNVRQNTFDAIAEALRMSPAELMVAIGKGRVSDDPKRVPIHARLREVPDEELSVVDRLIATFVPPTRAKSDSGMIAKSHRRGRSDLSSPAPEGNHTVLEDRKHRVPLLAFA